jgi:hypothetical protein
LSPNCPQQAAGTRIEPSPSEALAAATVPAATAAVVPLAPDDEHWHGLSVAGVLTRSVLDTALLLKTVAVQPRGAGGSPGRAEGRW